MAAAGREPGATPASRPSVSGAGGPTGWLLATDLDGTFLGGSDADRRHLFRLFKHSARLRVLYVTGRGVESVLPLLADPTLPDPDYIVADVGATIVRGADLEPVLPLQGEIEARWPGREVILEALSHLAGLELQAVPQERRCSFHTRDEGLIAEVRRAVAPLGCEVLHSAGTYLDVLPAGVNKGSTLRALLAQEGIGEARVVVAGDTLNDLALFELGLKGVVVGGAEPALTQATAGLEPPPYFATAKGAGGILEALHHHGILRDEPDLPERSTGRSQLVMVYHRLPFEEYQRDGRTHRRRPKSPNGILPTLLGFFADGRPGSWVAWSRQPNRAPPGFEVHVPVDEAEFPRLHAARIPLTADDVARFYEVFSKEAFWPVIFSFPGQAVFREELWQHYVDVNRLFAEQAAREAERGALVWIHDYNLWLVPGFLRELRPDVQIAFFHHTAFPPPDVFNIIPWANEIVGSLVQCDYIGFHIPRYVENFAELVRTHAPTTVVSREQCAPRYRTYGAALGVPEMTTELAVSNRRVGLGAHPVGINVALIEEILERPDSRQLVREIREGLGDRVGILSVERLDYVKGPLEKLLAFERLLEEHPELHGELVLINVTTPAAKGMRVYQHTRQRLDELIGRINGRFSRHDWTPVRYFFRSLPFEEVVAHYAACDVAWITPLRDGLNLVAKEFIAANAKVGRNGVLVLSEFAGAAVELHGAVLTNPYHLESMSRDLHRALTLGPAERGLRMKRLAEIVRANDIRAWGEDFLSACDPD